jgi:hypothetical protein
MTEVGRKGNGSLEKRRAEVDIRGVPERAGPAAHCHKRPTALSALPGTSRRGGPRWWHRPPTTSALDIASFVGGIIISNRGGLVASLQSASLITGQQVVALDFVHDAPPATVAMDGSDFVLPTTEGGGFAGLEASATALLDKVNTMPFKQIGDNLGNRAPRTADQRIHPLSPAEHGGRQYVRRAFGSLQ